MPRSSKKSVKKRIAVPAFITVPFGKVKASITDYMSRRPHRSFRLTRRRDAVRPLSLPGNIAFTHEVTKTVWGFKKPLSILAVIYLVLYMILIGVGSQESYQAIADAIQDASQQVTGGDLSGIGEAGLLFVSVFTLGISSAPGEAQQIFSVLLTLLVWLSVVWLLRNKLAGHDVSVRDSLYNSGAPIISTLIVTAVLTVQLLPLGIAAIGYAAASATGILQGGVEAMLFWIAAGLLGTLSLFWISSTLFAMVIVTLPGMYPFKALRIAGDVVLGRRIPILLRMIWMMLAVLAGWLVALIPVILLDMWLKSVWPAIAWLPIVPVAIAVVTTVGIVWTSSYVYLLYRKIVAQDAN